MPASEVMGKWKRGQLHSGSKKGPVVKSQKQAVAIMLSEKRKGLGDGGAIATTARRYQQGGSVDDYPTIGPGAPPYHVPLPRPRPKPQADYPTPNWLRGDRIVAYGGRIGYQAGGGDALWPWADQPTAPQPAPAPPLLIQPSDIAAALERWKGQYDRRQARKAKGYAYQGGGPVLPDESALPPASPQQTQLPQPSIQTPSQMLGDPARRVMDYLGQSYQNVRNYLTQPTPPTTAQTAAPGKIASENPYTAGALSTGTDILTSLINPEHVPLTAGMAMHGAGMLIPAGAKEGASAGAGQFFLRTAKALDTFPETKQQVTGQDWLNRFTSSTAKMPIKKDELAFTVGPYLQRNLDKPVSKDDLRRVIDDTGKSLDFTIREYPNRFGHTDVQPGSYSQGAHNYSFPGGDPGTYKEMLFQLPSRKDATPTPEIAAKYAPQLKELEDRAAAAPSPELIRKLYQPELEAAQRRVEMMRMRYRSGYNDESYSAYQNARDQLRSIENRMYSDPRLSGVSAQQQALDDLKKQMREETIKQSGSPESIPRLDNQGRPNKDFFLPTIGQPDYTGHHVHWGKEAAAGQAPPGSEATSNFANPNVFGHIRFDDLGNMNGKKTLRIHEFQSDLHQDARIGKSTVDSGYLDAGDPARQNALFRQQVTDAQTAMGEKRQELVDAMKAKKPEPQVGDADYYSYRNSPENRIGDLESGYRENYERPISNPEAFSRQINAIRAEYGDDIAKQAQDYAENQFDLNYRLGKGQGGGFMPNTPWKWSSPSSSADTLMFKALLHHAVENGYEQIVLPEGKHYAEGPYSIAGERTRHGLTGYYNDVFPRKMNQQVLEKAGIKDAKWSKDTTPHPIKNPEQLAQEKQKYLTERQAYIDRTYPEDDPDEWIQNMRRMNTQRMNEQAEHNFGEGAQSKNIMNYRVLPITDSIKKAVQDPNNLLHSAFKRGGGVMPHLAGGGFSGSTPWFTRQEARNMVPHGMLGGSGLGRTDNLPINVPSGAYVVPADIVSGIGHGNSQAGGSILAKAFSTGPLGMPAMHGKGGFGGPKNIRMGMMKMPRGSTTGSSITTTKTTPGFAGGGHAHGGTHAAPPGHTPIVAASGEFVIHPDTVLRIGKGNLKRGHDVLDKLMVALRKKHVKTLQNLPGPVKRASGGYVPDVSALLASVRA